MLFGALRKGKAPVTKRKSIGLVTVICKLLFIYNQKLNAYQKICGIRFLRAGVTKRMLTQLNRLYDSVSYQSVNSLLDSFAIEAENDFSNWTCDVVHCGDNVDVRKKARHELMGRSVYDFHMFNNLMYKVRIMCDNLSDIPPSVPPIDQVDMTQFLPNDEEVTELHKKLSWIILHLWNGLSNNPLKAQSPLMHTHNFSAEMRLKTEKVINQNDENG